MKNIDWPLLEIYAMAIVMTLAVVVPVCVIGIAVYTHDEIALLLALGQLTHLMLLLKAIDRLKERIE